MSPDIAMVALAGATGELLGCLDFWLPMARSELSKSSLTDFHYCTINKTCILRREWCSAVRHVDAIQRIGGCVKKTGECFQVSFCSGR